MENSVTLTLARYHDLIDIERDFKEQISKEVEGAIKHNSDFLKDALEDNDRLRKNVRQAKSIIFYMGGAFFLCLVALILSRILQ